MSRRAINNACCREGQQLESMYVLLVDVRVPHGYATAAGRFLQPTAKSQRTRSTFHRRHVRTLSTQRTVYSVTPIPDSPPVICYDDVTE